MSKSRILLACVLGLLVVSADSEAQFNKWKKKATDSLTKEADKKVDQAIDEVVKCVVGDDQCVEEAEAKGQEVVLTDADGNPVPDEPQQAQEPTEPAASAEGEPAGMPGEGVWRNYDFVPGRDVWFATDFSDERIGRFPASQLEFVKGNAQIVERDGDTLLEVSSATTFRINLPSPLADNFTVEFDILIPTANMTTSLFFSPPEGSLSQNPNHYVSIYSSPGVYLGGNAVSTISARELVGNMTPVKFQADGSYAILYVGEKRAANLPNVKIEPSDILEFTVRANDKFRTYINNIVVAVGLDPLYDTLMETGEFVTRGILFDLNSDRIRPESTPVLAELLRVLGKHPELTITIEGHTDNSGEDAYNLELSERRAVATVAYLTSKGIDPSRLASEGKGETEPAASNDTPQGQAQNRRVVIKRTS
jgi:OOP family OmpA-OmpF porin